MFMIHELKIGGLVGSPGVGKSEALRFQRRPRGKTKKLAATTTDISNHNLFSTQPKSYLKSIITIIKLSKKKKKKTSLP